MNKLSFLYTAAAAIPLLFSAGCDSFTSSQDVQRSTQNPPTTPQNLQTTVGPARIVLTWDINPNTNFFRVYWTDGGSDPTSTSNVVDSVDATLFDHKNLDWLKNYRYRVAAVNKAGASPLSAAVSATPISVPLTVPASLVASQGTATGAILLDWNTNPESGVMYTVWRKGTFFLDQFVQIADSIMTSSYVDVNVEEGVGYFYEVIAKKPSTAQVSSNSAPALGYTWKTFAESEPNNPPSSTTTGLWSSYANDCTGVEYFHISGGYSTPYQIIDTMASSYEDIDYFKITLVESNILLHIAEGNSDERGMTVRIGEVIDDIGVLHETEGPNLPPDIPFAYHPSSKRVYAYIKVSIPSLKGSSYTYKLDFHVAPVIK